MERVRLLRSKPRPQPNPLMIIGMKLKSCGCSPSQIRLHLSRLKRAQELRARRWIERRATPRRLRSI
jgi:hypothetical protein